MVVRAYIVELGAQGLRRLAGASVGLRLLSVSVPAVTCSSYVPVASVVGTVATTVVADPVTTGPVPRCHHRQPAHRRQVRADNCDLMRPG
jgi:hypothetical protein